MSRSHFRAASRPFHALALLGCLAIPFHFSNLDAQSVRGTLVEEGSGIPIEGVANMVKYIPLAAKFLIPLAIKSYIKRYPLTALPNIYMNEEIIPELVGVLKTDDITTRIEELLSGNNLAKIKGRLSCFQFDTNPVDVIVQELWGNPS